MAKKAKRSTTKKAPTVASEETKITRITASEDKKSTEKPAKKTAKVSTKKAETSVNVEAPKKAKKTRKNPLAAIGAYFKGSWYELRQVRWPDRQATWSMTGALLGFTAFFVVIILLLDALLQYLFSFIIGN